MCCYDDFGGGIQSCAATEPLRYILEERSERPGEVIFEVHGGLHRLYHRSDEKVSCAARKTHDISGLQPITGWNDSLLIVRDELVSTFSCSDAAKSET